MASQFSNKCIRYSVDPYLLQQGVPIENLSRQNEHEFKCQETMEQMSANNQRMKSLQGTLKSPTSEDHRYPDKREKLEIELSDKDYKKAVDGRLILISEEVAKSNGKKFKLINQKTNGYVVRKLTVINGKGLWQ